MAFVVLPIFLGELCRIPFIWKIFFAPYIETNNKKVQYKFVVDEEIMTNLYVQREDYQQWKKNGWLRGTDEYMWTVEFEPAPKAQKEPDLNGIDCEGILKLLEE